MATYTVKVDTAELRDAMTKFRNCQSEMASAYGAMATEVMSLYNNWQSSSASGEFYSKFSELQTNLKTSEGTVEQAVTGLAKAAEIYDELEEKNSQILSELGEISENFGG